MNGYPMVGYGSQWVFKLKRQSVPSPSFSVLYMLPLPPLLYFICISYLLVCILMVLPFVQKWAPVSLLLNALFLLVWMSREI